jgi:hypothetical protein
VAAPFTDRTRSFYAQKVFTAADGRLRDPDGMALEDWGLVDNLMLESCIARSGGRLVIHPAPPPEIFTSLAGFEECLRQLSRDRLPQLGRPPAGAPG